MKIVLTNDDGIDAPGIHALKQALSDIAECFVVAPSEQKSASAHAITLAQDIELRRYMHNGTFFGYSVKGTPVDCVKLALCELLPEAPDLLISGINQGPNTGVSVYYSGTVAAAREGAIAGVPSLAVSLASFEYHNFSYAAKLVCSLAHDILSAGLPRGIMLNINVPPGAEDTIKGIKITKQAESHFIEEYVKQSEDAERVVYALRGEMKVLSADGDSDEEAVQNGFVSISPLKLDLTEYILLETVRKIIS